MLQQPQCQLQKLLLNEKELEQQQHENPQKSSLSLKGVQKGIKGGISNQALNPFQNDHKFNKEQELYYKINDQTCAAKQPATNSKSTSTRITTNHFSRRTFAKNGSANSLTTEKASNNNFVATIFNINNFKGSNIVFYYKNNQKIQNFRIQSKSQQLKLQRQQKQPQYLLQRQIQRQRQRQLHEQKYQKNILQKQEHQIETNNIISYQNSKKKAQECQNAQTFFSRLILQYILKNFFTSTQNENKSFNIDIKTLNGYWSRQEKLSIVKNTLTKNLKKDLNCKKEEQIIMPYINNNNNKNMKKFKNTFMNIHENKEDMFENDKLLRYDMQQTIDFNSRRRRGRVRMLQVSGSKIQIIRDFDHEHYFNIDNDIDAETNIDYKSIEYLLKFKLFLDLMLNGFVNKSFENLVLFIKAITIMGKRSLLQQHTETQNTISSFFFSLKKFVWSNALTLPEWKNKNKIGNVTETDNKMEKKIKTQTFKFYFQTLVALLNLNFIFECFKINFGKLYKGNNQLPSQQNTRKSFDSKRVSRRYNFVGCFKHSLCLILCLSISMISYNSNMVSAAKPKSATQLQQQQKQHQQHSPNFNGNHGLTPPSYQIDSPQQSDEAELIFPPPQSEEQMFDEESLQDIKQYGEHVTLSYETQFNGTHYENVSVIKTPLFPKDLFTKEQLENGAVFCHILGVIYMFVALAIVCDEFFVPSLDVIIEKLGITDDVAGATFMAAGGSAPELFTSVIGVFVSFDDVGIGTIVGSAVFNILFVIGMCALFSKTVLSLTWWPLFRDCTFYSISLLVLIYFFRDSLIYWWEALILFSIYAAYVTFMKWNVQVESCVKKMISKNKGNAANSSETSMATQPGGSVTSRAASETRSGPPGSSSAAGGTGNSSGTAGSTQTGAKFRHGLLQLMIHTIDPLHDGKVDEKATQLHAIASLKVLLDATKPQRGGATTSAANHVKINLKETTLADRPNGNIDTTLDSPSLSGRRPSWIDQRVKIQTRKFSIKQTNEIEEEPEPLSMAWPDTARKRLTYILVAPLLIPMWLTLPDTRTPRGKKLFPITFIGSIVWIAAFSYLMVWWANVAGDTARIPPEVMGLTFLAAGTSIPDLITSVIVARKGFGDMAVSSSVGSNIFDVTVGLPIPWLLYGIFYGAPVQVNSVGMVCSITILFMMLIFVVMSIACFRWRMNKGLGFTMFLLYFVFVAVSLMFEYDAITCPV